MTTPGEHPDTRILFAGTTFVVGGAERVFAHLVRGLRDRGYHAELLALRELGPVGEELRGEGVPTHSGFTGSQRVDLTLLPRLSGFLRQRPFDVIYFLDHAHAVFYITLASLGTSVRIRLMPVHTTGQWGGAASLKRPIRLVRRHLDRIISIAEAQKRYLMETEGIPESQLVVIPNGIPLEVSSERERRARRREVRAEIWGGGASDVGSDVRGEGAGDAAGDVRSDVGGEGAGGGAGDVGSDVRGEGAGDAVGDVRSDVGSGERRAGDRKVVGITAVLRPEKNHELLMAAFARVRRETDAELWIVGDGPRRPDLEELARSLGISGSVRFLGLRPDARRIMYGFDVAVLSSHPLVETLPLALMEAMDAGVPLVATRVGALAEMIEDGRSGLLVDPGDEEGLARALRSVLLDSERAARFSRAGSEIVRRRFSVDQMVTQTENLIQTLLSARRS